MLRFGPINHARSKAAGACAKSCKNFGERERGRECMHAEPNLLSLWPEASPPTSIVCLVPGDLLADRIRRAAGVQSRRREIARARPGPAIASDK